MKRIHIVGSGPRTGTTLLAEVMHTCFKIDHHCEHEAPICTDEPKSGAIFLTKLPGEISSVKWPLRLNSELYVICVIRDPRDSIVSRHGSQPDVYWAGLRSWKEFCKIFPKLASRPRFIYFRYEDFVSEPNKIQRHIKENIPFLNETHKFSDYHLLATPSVDSIKALKSVRPIAPVGVGSWKKHLPRIKEQVSIHGDITSELIAHGYEMNSDWESALDGIEDREFPQNLPQFISVREHMRHAKTQWIEVFNILCRRINIDPRPIKVPFIFFKTFFKSLLKITLKPILIRFK
jgi:hypothetical protein